ncbi:hypothetical protein D3X11_05825 [Streptococcus sp. X16XC17]|uniref:hypothetical protein n=1 Tax=unclassified Streptococcus TaxID=2608887 RepID=UPI00066FC1C9|nr:MULTISPECIES: hypothetical protein [unclassified Streptococcus]TCD45739.1 hypothetical protein D3X11_05825 [Streptococcus sp. X16XC17]
MKKESSNLSLKIIFASFFALLAVLSLAACSLFKGQSIDGKWTSPTAAQELLSEAMGEANVKEIFTYSDHTFSEILTDASVDLSIKNDKAVMQISMMVDHAAFLTAMSDEYKAGLEESLASSGLTYEELDDASKKLYNESMPTEEKLNELIDQTFEMMASGMDRTYDKEAGMITTELFKGKVNRNSRVIELTDMNSLAGYSLKDGDKQSYIYEGGDKLVLNGAAVDGKDMVFELVK